MKKLEIQIDPSPSPDDIEKLSQGLTEHAQPFVESPGFQPLAAFARGPAGEVVGGVYCLLNWTWLHVSLLWVAPELRHQKLGSRLLREVESAAAERGCRHAHLDTFSFQAKQFYERHGYGVFAALDDYPLGHQRFFLRKDLESAA